MTAAQEDDNLRRGSKDLAFHVFPVQGAPITGSNSLADVLDRLTAALEAAGSPVLAALLPGLSPEQARQLAGGLPFELDEQLVELYGWHNGTDGSAGVPGLTPGTIFMSEQDAIADYSQRVEISHLVATDEFEAPEIYDPSWFPVILDAGGNGHVVFHSGERKGSVWFIPTEEPEMRYEAAPSLAAFLDQIAECYERGAYFVRSGLVYDDPNLEAEIARARLDPPPDVGRLIKDVASRQQPAASLAFRTILRLRFPESVSPLIGLLSHHDAPVRRNAALLLGKLGDPDAHEALSAATEDSDPSVRKAASGALDELRGSQQPRS
jgi:cell wall assembly regulator SMI1